MSSKQRRCGDCGTYHDEGEMLKRKFSYRCRGCVVASRATQAERDAVGKQKTDLNQKARKAAMLTDRAQAHGFKTER